MGDNKIQTAFYTSFTQSTTIDTKQRPADIKKQVAP